MDSRSLTKGTAILLGSPERAIRRLALPMMFAMIFMAVYNLADGIWVAGLGTNALAAIGLFFPLYMIVIAVSTGLSVGVSSALSRFIGKKDEKSADNTAVAGLWLSVGVAMVVILLLFPFLGDIFDAMAKAPAVHQMVLQYAKVLILFSPLFVLNYVFNGILRGEGAAARSMYIMVFGTVLNILLDPLFIYIFKLGVKGAAWATVISVASSCLLAIYWLFVKKDTYVRLHFSGFKFTKEIIVEILKVGIPAALMQIVMGISVFFLNMIIVRVSGDQGVAILTSAWRVIMLGLVPLFGLASAVTVVVGANFGAREYEKMRRAYFYGAKAGFILELLVLIVWWLTAPYIAYLFSYNHKDVYFFNMLVHAIRILIFFLPFAALGIVTSASFQGLGEGSKALAVTTLRTIVFQLTFAFVLGTQLKMGLAGVFWGIVFGNISAALLGFGWGILVLKRLKSKLLGSS